MIQTEWSLDRLYPAYNTSFTGDIEKLKGLIEDLKNQSLQLSGLEDVEKWLRIDQSLSSLSMRLFAYIGLNLATDINDKNSNDYEGKLLELMSQTVIPNAQFKNFIKEHEGDFKHWCETSALIKEHEFMLQEIINLSSHDLDEKIEDVMARLHINGSNNWSKLQDYLTSKTTQIFKGKTETLTTLRNYAYSPKPVERKEAYEAELSLYPKIEDAVSFALNSIKGEVNITSKLRGYESGLDESLTKSRLSKQSLNALFTAIDEYLPTFRKYLRHKAKLLGYNDGLPWYELFAPISTANVRSFTVEESKDFIVESFSDFSEDLADMARQAYHDAWIDFMPKQGKSGGAFCYNLPIIKESRILTNFDGSISDVTTLAHELGHAYHGKMIEDLSILNTDYSMPVAETASTFCENIVFNAALKTASESEQLVLIENSLQDVTQIVVDIYSRFKFEQAVFEQRKDTLLFPKDLKEIMLQAQRETYGDGLNESLMHPYMWICKGHYYSAGFSYYNYPYAFGGLFALGLYAKFIQEGASFVPKYQDLLKATTTHSCEDVAMKVGVDITNPDFWRSSLELIENRIDRFIELSSKE